MHGSLAANEALLAALRAQALPAGVAVAVCPPFPYLAQAGACLQGSAISWGAQDVSASVEPGAYTGEVQAAMLAELGCRWVLVGHSERRSNHHESDALVADKAAAALAAGLTPVVCVGETLAEQAAGQPEDVITRQLAPVLALGQAALERLVVAYEPVWAIGTGRAATPEQAQAVHAAIRSRLAAAGAPGVPLLYGGSVKAGNAASLFAMPDIDGALVGGASLSSQEFLNIALAAAQATE